MTLHLNSLAALLCENTYAFVLGYNTLFTDCFFPQPIERKIFRQKLKDPKIQPDMIPSALMSLQRYCELLIQNPKTM